MVLFQLQYAFFLLVTQTSANIIARLNTYQSVHTGNINSNTQGSLDMTNFGNLGNLINSHHIYSLDRTDFHLQEESNLCHSFATVSAFRRCLVLLIISFRSIFVGNPKFDEIITEIKKSDGKFPFKDFFKVFVACVNPRSFQGLAHLKNEEKFIERQFAELETVIKRLVLGTTFEIEGWKRILPARDIFNELSLDINDFELEMKKVDKADFEVRLSIDHRLYKALAL